MRPLNHLMASLAIAPLVWLGTEDVQVTLAAMIGQLMLDLDHLVEYGLHARSSASMQDFLRPGSISQWPQLVFFMHGYEWVALGIGVGVELSSPVLVALFMGSLAHLLLDEVGNRLPGIRHRIHPLFYFFLFRLLRGFRTKAISRML